MALCVGCGNDLFGGKVCYKCGLRVGGNEGVPQTPASPAPQYQQPQYQQPQYQQPQYQQPQFQPQFQQQFPTAQKTNGLAIASFVCSFFVESSASFSESLRLVKSIRQMEMAKVWRSQAFVLVLVKR